MVNYAVVYRCAASFSPILTVPQRLKLKDVVHLKTYQRHMNRIYGRRTDYKCETDEPVCDTFILLPHIDYSCSNFVCFVFDLVLVLFLCICILICSCIFVFSETFQYSHTLSGPAAGVVLTIPLKSPPTQDFSTPSP